MKHVFTTKKKSFLKGLFFLVLMVTMTSCETSTLSELAEREDTEEPPLELVTYDNTASTILNNACVECHSTVIPTAGIILDSFDAARAVAESGRMITRMRSTSNPMPPSGNLPNSIIDDIMDLSLIHI